MEFQVFEGGASTEVTEVWLGTLLVLLDFLGVGVVLLYCSNLFFKSLQETVAILHFRGTGLLGLVFRFWDHFLYSL